MYYYKKIASIIIYNTSTCINRNCVLLLTQAKSDTNICIAYDQMCLHVTVFHE